PVLRPRRHPRAGFTASALGAPAELRRLPLLERRPATSDVGRGADPRLLAAPRHGRAARRLWLRSRSRRVARHPRARARERGAVDAMSTLRVAWSSAVTRPNHCWTLVTL